MDGGAWWATVHGVTKSLTQLSGFTSSKSQQDRWLCSHLPMMKPEPKTVIIVSLDTGSTPKPQGVSCCMWSLCLDINREGYLPKA